MFCCQLSRRYVLLYRQFEFYFVFRDVVDIVYVVTGAVASPEFVGFVGHDPDVLG